LECIYECLKDNEKLDLVVYIIPYAKGMLLIRIACKLGFLFKFKEGMETSDSEENDSHRWKKGNELEKIFPVISYFDDELLLMAFNHIMKNDLEEAKTQLFIWTSLLENKNYFIIELLIKHGGHENIVTVENVNKKIRALDNNVNQLEKNIDSRLNMLEKNMLEKMEDMNQKMEDMNQKLREILSHIMK